METDSMAAANNKAEPGPRAATKGDSLVARLTRDLRELILSGQAVPGEKLPSQAELTRTYHVSRTVVREAVAALQADGLVKARHGAGVFVLDPDVQPTAFRPVDQARISAVIDLLELRAAVEIEAAALAAQRRSPAQEEAIYARFADMDQQVEAGGIAVAADLAFHMAIAEATNNPRFREFLLLLGEHLIPRSVLSADAADAPSPAYIKQIQGEHRAIIDAISARDDAGASEAMRKHLKGSESRYRRLLQSSK